MTQSESSFLISQYFEQIKNAALGKRGKENLIIFQYNWIYEKMIKTKYVLEVQKDNELILIQLITFDIAIYCKDKMVGWIENNLCKLEKRILTDLCRRHFIVGTIKDDEEILKMAQLNFSKRKLRVPNIVIYLTNKCNLRCSYCYTGYENDKAAEVINEMDVDNIFDSIEEIYKRKEYLKAYPIVSLFGGEPLLISNTNILKYIIDKLNDLAFSNLEIVTNLINIRLFKDVILGFNNAVSLKVTLNGNDEIHDKIRKFANGSGTYKIIIDNIDYVLKYMPNSFIDLSILVEKSISLSGVKELFNEFAKRGFLDNSRFKISFGHIQFRSKYVCEGFEDRIINVADYYPMLFEFKKKIPQVKDEMIAGSSMYILKEIFRQIKGETIVTPNFCGCDAIYPGRICYFTDGNIYPCFDCVGMEEFAIGKYRNGFQLNEFYEVISNFSVKDLKKCNECKFVGICNGGCIISNISKNGEISEVFCENVKESLIKFIDYLYEENIFNELQY